MRTTLVLVCVCVALTWAEPATLVQEPSEIPAPGGTVDSIIPEFQTGDEWSHANARQRAAYSKAEEFYKKTNAEKYKAQGEKRKELNEKAQEALDKLKNAKESMQKKYAKDDPIDFPGAEMTSSDKANEKRDKEAEKAGLLKGSGTYGASGVPGHKKWYSSGVISSDSYRDEQGHYILGPSRRRVGAGFGRRRRIAAANATDAPIGGGTVQAIEHGHDLLKEGLGAPEDADVSTASPTETSEIIKGMVGEDARAYAAMRDATKNIHPPLPPGVVIANKHEMHPDEKKTLKATGAGVDAEVDSHGHFEATTDIKIVGAKVTESITGGDSSEVTPVVDKLP